MELVFAKNSLDVRVFFELDQLYKKLEYSFAKRLANYEEQHLWDKVKMAYFVVSLPEFQIFNEDYTARNKAHCYYLMGLGNLGLGDLGRAELFFRKVLSIEPSHIQSTLYIGRFGELSLSVESVF